ncbi:MAG: CvpA family protein [Candidatus Omnitrophica bacterium]|nr:CvpA family protein [Candidatus Omnitrophota bacterium]
MIIDFFRHINWLDIFVVILLFRVCYISTKSRILVEILKFASTVCAIYLSLHYYAAFADFLHGATNFPSESLYFISFCFLAALGYMLIVGLRLLILRFAKDHELTGLDRWGSPVVGAFRAFLLAGLLIFALGLWNVPYLKESIKSSFSGRGLFNVAPNTYSFIWNHAASKIFPASAFNRHIREAEGNLDR